MKRGIPMPSQINRKSKSPTHKLNKIPFRNIFILIHFHTKLFGRISNSIKRPSKNAFSVLSSSLPSPSNIANILLNGPKDNYHYSATTLYKFRRCFRTADSMYVCIYTNTLRSAAFTDTSDSNSGRFYFPWNYIFVFSCFLIVYTIFFFRCFAPQFFSFFFICWFLNHSWRFLFRPVKPFKGPFEIWFKSKFAGLVLLPSFTRNKGLCSSSTF